MIGTADVWMISEELDLIRSCLNYREKADIEFEKQMETKYSSEQLDRIIEENSDDPISIEYERYFDTFQFPYGDFPYM